MTKVKGNNMKTSSASKAPAPAPAPVPVVTPQVSLTPSQEQVIQLQTTKFSNGLQAGLKLLETEGVDCPITLHEGLTDLKWLIQALLSGQFTIKFEPKNIVNSPQIGQQDADAGDE